MERMKKGAELAAWHHGYQAGEFAVARLCRSDKDHLLPVRRFGSSEGGIDAGKGGAEPRVRVHYRVVLRL